MIENRDKAGSKNHQFRAVLWDIDGTLLLSESMHFRALRHAAGTEDVFVPDDFHHEIVGRAARVVYQTARERFGLSMTFDQWRRLKYGYYTAHADEIEVRPGALEAWRTFAELGLRLRYLSGGLSDESRTIDQYVLPERAGYYLGSRMVERAVSERGMAWTVRASADEISAISTLTAASA